MLSEQSYPNAVHDPLIFQSSAECVTVPVIKHGLNCVAAWQYDQSRHGEERSCVPLQVLAHLCYRWLIFMCLQLQKLFAMLRFSVRGAVDTAPLTRSFGWTSAETFMQQDVHECLSVLFQFLRESDAAASIGQEISSNHVGQQVAYIKCLECGYVSLRPEEMVELTLQVRGSPTLEHSIARYDRVTVIVHI